MSTYKRFKMVAIWVALFAFLLPTIGGFVSIAMAGEGGGSGDPMNNPPPPNSPGGIFYKAPPVWYQLVLNYMKFRWGRWFVF